jgi:hypothetical protein
MATPTVAGIKAVGWQLGTRELKHLKLSQMIRLHLV